MNYNLIIRVGRKGKSPEQKVSHCNGCHKIEKKIVNWAHVCWK
jgi:hypothetical protein